jgi:hypothetical protein
MSQSTKITLKQFKSLITQNRVYDVMEHSFRPALAGTERLIVQPQTNGWFFLHTSATDGKRYWQDMPKASDILASVTDGFGDVMVTLALPQCGESHKATYKFYLEVGEELR